jgi:hypothetical protein
MLTYGHINGRNQPVVAAAARDMLDRPPCEARFASSDGAEFSQTDITTSMNRIALLILLTWAIPGHAANILNDPLIELVARAKKIERGERRIIDDNFSITVSEGESGRSDDGPWRYSLPKQVNPARGSPMFRERQKSFQPSASSQELI